MQFNSPLVSIQRHLSIFFNQRLLHKHLNWIKVIGNTHSHGLYLVLREFNLINILGREFYVARNEHRLSSYFHNFNWIWIGSFSVHFSKVYQWFNLPIQKTSKTAVIKLFMCIDRAFRLFVIMKKGKTERFQTVGYKILPINVDNWVYVNGLIALQRRKNSTEGIKMKINIGKDTLMLKITDSWRYNKGNK